jgi:hypothetical protein
MAAMQQRYRSATSLDRQLAAAALVVANAMRVAGREHAQRVADLEAQLDALGAEFEAETEHVAWLEAQLRGRDAADGQPSASQLARPSAGSPPRPDDVGDDDRRNPRRHGTRLNPAFRDG